MAVCALRGSARADLQSGLRLRELRLCAYGSGIVRGRALGERGRLATAPFAGVRVSGPPLRRADAQVGIFGGAMVGPGAICGSIRR
ncbi:hypothetical protein GCM10009646_80590 [Streptomyces aureus]